MADSPGQRLAGIFGPRFRDAMAVPQEDLSVKLARALGAFGQGGGAPTPAYQQPFSGLRNAPLTSQTLPPFEPPGTAFANAMPPIAPAAAPAPTPQAQALPSPTAATQPQLGGADPASLPPATAVPPMPPPVTVRDDVLKAAQQMLAQNLLPEQWKGAFSTPPGMPR